MKRRDNEWDGGGAVGGIGSICGSAVRSWVHDKVMVEPMAVKFLRLCTSKIDHYVHLVKIMKTLNMMYRPYVHAFMGNLEVWPENMGLMSSSWCRNLEKWNEDA